MAAERPRLEIAQLVAEHHQAVYRYAYRLSGSVADAEDLSQQVFLSAQQKLHQLQNPEKVRNWLFAMLRNEFLKDRRRGRRLGIPDPAESVAWLPAEPPSDESIDREKLQQALNSLAADYRTVLLMYYFEDLSYREIAEQAEIPIGTVMSRLARAKRSLRAALFETDGEQSDAQPTNVVGRQFGVQPTKVAGRRG
jgi:RNA polymerase sigma-70 factor (ECF subfamily)